jgi:hypothetical protein
MSAEERMLVHPPTEHLLGDYIVYANRCTAHARASDGAVFGYLG